MVNHREFTCLTTFATLTHRCSKLVRAAFGIRVPLESDLDLDPDFQLVLLFLYLDQGTHSQVMSWKGLCRSGPYPFYWGWIIKTR